MLRWATSSVDTTQEAGPEMGLETSTLTVSLRQPWTKLKGSPGPVKGGPRRG